MNYFSRHKHFPPINVSRLSWDYIMTTHEEAVFKSMPLRTYLVLRNAVLDAMVEAEAIRMTCGFND